MQKILIVDEEKIRAVIKEYADFEGYKVFEATDGMEAVNMVKQNDILLS